MLECDFQKIEIPPKMIGFVIVHVSLNLRKLDETVVAVEQSR